jgi:TolB-like protein
VVRAVLGWGILSFAVLQIYEPVMHGLHLPEWTLTLVVVVLGVGFPATFVLAWIFDMGPGGVERTPSAAKTPATPARRVFTAFLLIGLGVIFSIPGLAWYVSLERARSTSAAGTSQGSVASGGGSEPGNGVPGSTAAPSIAVLPFADMSPGHDQEYFADGVAEEILNALAHVPGLRVIGRTSSFSFKARNEDLRSIGKKLDVATVLEGSLRKNGSRVKVTAQLINVTDGSHLWSETYDRDQADIFAVQEQVAAAVVEALKVKLLPGAGIPGSGPRTASTEAYEQYLLASQLVARFTPEDVKRAITALERAVALDPGMAAAWAKLSLALWWNADYDTPEDKAARERAVQAADRAVELDPRLAEGYASRARARSTILWDFAGAVEDDRRARQLAPSSPDVLLVQCIVERAIGNLPESIRACQRVIELDPLSVGARNQLSYTLLASGDRAQARLLNDRSLEISPRSVAARYIRCELDFLEGNRDAVRDHCGSALEDDGDRLFWSAMAESEWGTPDEARRLVDTFAQRFGKRDPASVAELHAWRGDADRAFEWIGKAYSQRVGLGEVKADPFLRKLRGDPRFRAVLQKMKLPVD